MLPLLNLGNRYYFFIKNLNRILEVHAFQLIEK